MSKGLYSNTELIDTIIVDLNNSVKLLIDNQFIAFCDSVNSISRRLVNLKNGIIADMKSKDENIEALKEQLKLTGNDVTPEQFLKDMEGSDNGSN